MLDQLLSLVVPPVCAACRAPGRRAADVLCGACRRSLPWLDGPCCERCALPLPHVARCPAHDAPFHAAWSAVAYEGTAREVMHALKFAAARPLADVMAAQIAANAPALRRLGAHRRDDAGEPEPVAWAPGGRCVHARDATGAGAGAGAGQLALRAIPKHPGRHSPRGLDPADAGAQAIVAVPAHPGRRRARGFDPAELLARALARRTGMAHVRTLQRGGGDARQLGASRELRRDATRLAYSARVAAPRQVVLVDDVHTTGSTLAACSRALRDAGAKHILAITWARAL